MDNFTMMFDTLIAICGVYMLFWAASGTGPLYKSENIKAGKISIYKKFMRLFCLIGGILSIATGVLDFLKAEPFATVAFIALCCAVAFVTGMLLTFTDPQKVKKHVRQKHI